MNLQLTDDEVELILNTLAASLSQKEAAFQVAHATVPTFTPRDFGIPQIEALIAKLEEE